MKEVLTDQQVRFMSEADLFERLCAYFGEPDTWQAFGLRDAAHQIVMGRLTWSQVQQAIDQGWNPRDRRIMEYLGDQPTRRVGRPSNSHR